MRTLSFLETKEIEAIAWKAFTESGLPKPRGIRVEEREDSNAENTIFIDLLVTDKDDLGTAEQRLEAGGKIQSAVWSSGDNRSAIMLHSLFIDEARKSAKSAL